MDRKEEIKQQIFKLQIELEEIEIAERNCLVTELDGFDTLYKLCQKAFQQREFITKVNLELIATFLFKPDIDLGGDIETNLRSYDPLKDIHVSLRSVVTQDGSLSPCGTLEEAIETTPDMDKFLQKQTDLHSTFVDAYDRFCNTYSLSARQRDILKRALCDGII